MLLVLLPPGEDRLGEDVVEELVARALLVVSGCDGTEDAAALAAAQLVEHGGDLWLGTLCPLGQIGGRMGDLRLGTADEEAEAARRDVLLGECEPAERLEEMVLDDPGRSAECLEAGECERVLAGCNGLAPEPLEDELQERRLHPVAGRVPGRNLPARLEGQPPTGGRGEHCIDERGLDRERLRAVVERPVPGLDRPLDRLARAVEVEMVDPDVVREERRDVPLEAVELGPRVLADREQHMDGQARVVDDPRELSRESGQSLVVALVGVVLEVLLELVEHDEERPVASDPRAERLGERRTRRGKRLLQRGPGGLAQTSDRIVAPRPEDAHGRRRLLAQCVDGTGHQQRALADPARPVEDRQPGRAQVRRDDRHLDGASEEERRIALVVGDEPDVRARWRGGTHQPRVAAARGSLASSSRTYSLSSQYTSSMFARSGVSHSACSILL
jgi:hypothetical protein